MDPCLCFERVIFDINSFLKSKLKIHFAWKNAHYIPLEGFAVFLFCAQTFFDFHQTVCVVV